MLGRCSAPKSYHRLNKWETTAERRQSNLTWMEVELNFQSAANFYFFFIKFSYISQKEQPRSCGEYRSSLLSLGLVQGTPLHARGIR